MEKRNSSSETLEPEELKARFTFLPNVLNILHCIETGKEELEIIESVCFKRVFFKLIFFILDYSIK